MAASKPRKTPEIRHPSDDEWFEHAKRVATPRTDDDRTILAGMDRPATPEELVAYLEHDQARIRRERGLPPP